jgi:hypothetical protein
MIGSPGERKNRFCCLRSDVVLRFSSALLRPQRPTDEVFDMSNKIFGSAHAPGGGGFPNVANSFLVWLSCQPGRPVLNDINEGKASI